MQVPSVCPSSPYLKKHCRKILHSLAVESRRCCFERFLHDPGWLVDMSENRGGGGVGCDDGEQMALEGSFEGWGVVSRYVLLPFCVWIGLVWAGLRR